jgi:spore maturation protein CgeB
MKKKVLDIKTEDLATNDIIWGALEAGHDCEQLSISCGTNDFNDIAIAQVKSFADAQKPDIVITMNFCPSVSKACYDMGIPYASWLYDAPLQAVYHEEAKRSTNYFFAFDKYLLRSLKELGYENVNYLPLAANVTRTGMVEITESDEAQFGCDISFVGNQYVDGRYAYYKNRLEPDLADELERIADNMLGKWDKEDRVHDVMSQELVDAMTNLSADEPYKKTGVPNRLYFEAVVVPRAVAYTERRIMMKILSDLHPRWYGAGADEKDKIPGVEYLPWLKYEITLPKA